MSGRLTIKDIAARMGVSAATVSRALSGSDLVAADTAERIRALARDLDFRPNVSARNLRTLRSQTVLLVVRDVGNPFYLDVLKGVEATARSAGYAVLMGNTEDDPEREAEYFDMLRDGHADGMILMTGKLPAAARGRTADQLAARPVVVALEMIEGNRLPHVQIDNGAAARLAVDHLLSLGHRRIAHVSGPTPEIMSVYRLAGYKAAMAEAGLAVPEDYIQRGRYTLDSGAAACASLLELASPPTAIFVANDEMAFGVIHELRRRGLRVPEDMSVVGFDDLPFAQVFHPPLTTIRQPRLEIGRAAMGILLDMLGGGAAPARPSIMPTELCIRGTTAPPAPD